MKFKSPHMQEQLDKAHPKVMEVALEFAKKSLEIGIEAIVTRVSDAVKGESGVHPDGRAIDFRDEHGGKRLYTNEQVTYLVTHMNSKFKRKDRFKTCLHHAFNGGPLHFHLQVSAKPNSYEETKNG